MSYPQIPVSRPSIGKEEWQEVASVLESEWLTQGHVVRRFEGVLAKLLHVHEESVVACSSGTAALHLSLAAFGIGPDDEVLVPDLTYVATANAVKYCGAHPILVDVDQNWTIDLEKAEHAVTSRTRAIIPVHLYGVSCDMDAVMAFAEKHQLIVIEDAAQAFYSTSGTQFCGTLGDAGTFSFYGNKLITTGEGGAVISAKGADRARLLRGQAQDPNQKFMHTEVGFNYRMTDIHAALGSAQVYRLHKTHALRRRVIEQYRNELPQSVLSPMFLSSSEVSPWLATIALPGMEQRDLLAAKLASLNIETRPVFVPLHRMPMYSHFNESLFPAASFAADHGLSLPTYAELELEDVSMICRVVKEFAA